MPNLKELRTSIFADGADLGTITRLRANPLIRGFTTNPTLMRKSNVTDYRAFAHDLLQMVPDLPVSFEVFSDDLAEMEEQALEISSWGPNVYVKIPVANTAGESAAPLVRRLSRAGVQLNVTAILTLIQVDEVAANLAKGTSSFVSIFAGRIADTGRDPMPTMAQAVRILGAHPGAQVLWASCRELLNIFQADAVGCHAITVTADILAKLPMVGKDLTELSLETVRMFRQDAVKAGYQIAISSSASQVGVLACHTEQ